VAIVMPPIAQRQHQAAHGAEEHSAKPAPET
jgi:hypothetical protein